MSKRKCDYCKKTYDPKKHIWSAGYGCDYYCSKDCCINAWLLQGSDLSSCPSCPCY